jgi:hypothetical protein
MGQNEQNYYYMKGALDYREKLLRTAYEQNGLSLDDVRGTFPDDPADGFPSFTSGSV